MSESDVSAAEMRVWKYVAQAKRDKEIAYALGVSISTVKAHVGRLLAKLNATNRVALALEFHGIGRHD